MPLNLWDWFLTPPEKANVARFTARIEDRSITSKVMAPFWDYVAQFVPDHVAPNVLSLSGLMCLVHAYYLCYMYMDQFPRLITAAAVFLAFAFQTLDSIDGRHARRIRNHSPIGELFAFCCANVGTIFLSLVLCAIVGIKDTDLQWYIVQTAQVLFMHKHFSAFRNGVLRFSILTGPGEALFAFNIIALVRAVIGLDWFYALLHTLPIDFTLQQAVSTLYYLVYFSFIVQALLLPKEHYSTRNGLVFCLLYRVIPALTIQFVVGRARSTHWDIICDGIFMSVVTSDLILATMAKRELHPWVVVFAMLSLFHNLATISVCLFYYVAVFADLCHEMNLPMFSVCRNVYASGVFDLCHVGHMRLFENALRFGTRLYVGVCNDEDCEVYKRRPIMTHKERCEAVAACKFVHEVIPNAPCFDLPVEFLLKHNIHVVALSPEYDTPDDQFYAGARELGITKVLPRTEGMSTSELIRRIKDHPNL